MAFYERGKLARVEEDRNRDGRPDVWVVYRDGQRVEQREDPKLARLDEATGGDGRFDLVSFYERDALVRQEGRTACGDRTDVWIRYRDGQKAEQAEDHDCDGRPDMRFVYEADAVVRKEALK